MSGDRQVVEKYLSRLETEFESKIGRMLRRLRAGEYVRLHPETRHTIAVYAAVQLVRTKEHRIKGRQISEQMLRFLAKHPGTERLAAEVRESMSERALREAHARMMLDLPTIARIADVLSSHIWVIAHRHPAQSFYLSDEPITTHGHVMVPFRGNDGIGCRGVEVHVPLSHDYALTLYEREHFAEFASRDGRVLELTSQQHMIYQRRFAVKFSTRLVFCRDDDFDLARHICTEEPHWRDPERKRVTSNHDSE